jgi:lipopolysaccharide transport system ATP-binding protein
MPPVIQISNLCKIYRLGEIGTGTISRDLERWYKMKIRGQEDPFLKIGETNESSKKGVSDVVYSLKDINFEVKQGEALGIIGKNGAGKSTLLKIISRVTSPTTGKIKIKGRVASLLEVGTGFHPELTGRENIYLNGAILGMRKKEITRKLDEIIDFSGVERYIDTPVKRYSSGMYVRLAFAVAAHLESEIMIIDEVLAVGDAEFQKKCLGKMGEVSKGEGRTVLFVSHNMGAIRSLCERAIWIDNGQIVQNGTADEVVRNYEEKQQRLFGISSYIMVRNPDEVKGKRYFYGRVEMLNEKGEHTTVFRYNDKMTLIVDFAGEPGGPFSPEFHIYNELGQFVACGAAGPYHDKYFSSKVRKVRIEIGPLTITSGQYRILLSVMTGHIRSDTWENAAMFNIFECQPFATKWEIPAFREGVCVLQQSFNEVAK